MTKRITVQGQSFRLHSKDGNLWVSDTALFQQIADRQQMLNAQRSLKPWEKTMILNYNAEEPYDATVC